MESAFFETRRAAELLQQFSGVLFVGTVYFCPPPFHWFSAMHHTCSCPAALFDLHSVCISLGTLGYFAAASSRYFPVEYPLW